MNNTPKEKAEELVDKNRIILMNEDTDCGNEILCTLIAIKSAKITAEQIIGPLKEKLQYWEDVIDELNQL